MAAVDPFSDIRRTQHGSAKYFHESAALAAFDEILATQGLGQTPVAYLGVITMSLESDEAAEPAVHAGMLALLERVMTGGRVPRALLVSKAQRISTALVSIAHAHPDHEAVLCAVLTCVLRLLTNILPTSGGQRVPPDPLKLFHWLLAFVVHSNTQVRARGQAACCNVLERCPALSDAAAQFVETRLAAAALKDIEPAMHVLAFLKQGIALFSPAPLSTAAHAVMRLTSVGHPALARAASVVLIELCSAQTDTPTSTALLVAIIERPFANGASSAARADPGALRAAAAAATALHDSDENACYAQLPTICAGWVRAMWHRRVEGGGGSRGKSDDDGGALESSELHELVETCVRPSMPKPAAEALAAAFLELLTPRYAPLREEVLGTCAALLTGLGTSATPACDELLKGMAQLYADRTLGSARPVLLASLGKGAKAIGPERFIELLPIRVSTDGGEDTSWLLAALRNHIGNARLGFFGSYFLPLTDWLLGRATQMETEKREVEARNLRNLHEQVWALLPGFCACARDVADALPPIARVMGVAIAERPEVRGHVLQALSLIVQTARSRKEAVAAEGGGAVTLQLTADAQAALATVGRFGKNFLPLLFNVHQAEPPEKRPPLQEAVGAVASVTPPETLAELFASMMRKLLEPTLSEGGADKALEAQRGLLDLLIALSPHLSPTHVGMLSRAVRPTLLSPDVLLQKKAYKVVSALSTHHQAWVRAELATLREALSEALPACAPGCKGKRLACLQAVTVALPSEQLTTFLPELLGEVVLATREVNVKTRAAAFEFLVGLTANAQRRAASDAARVANVRGLLMMIAGGLAGSTAHMIAASLSALGRLTFELRDVADVEPTLVQLFRTVLALLAHSAHEVVKAALSFVKVGLASLSPEAVEPLLPSLVPPMLVWCSNKHPHLKTQCRYVMERLVKRFGYDVMMEVTPEQHQRLLVHMRKQKVRASNHAAARRAERDQKRTAAAAAEWGEDAREAAERRERHAEYEALLDEDGGGDGSDGDDDGGEDGGDGASPGLKAKAKAAAAAFARRRSKSEFSVQSAWMDTADSAAGLDILSAPLMPMSDRASASAGKRSRDGNGGAGSTAYNPLRDKDAAKSDGSIRFDEDGKLIVTNGGAEAIDGIGRSGASMDMDEDDEGDDDGGERSAKKRRRTESSSNPGKQNSASAMEEREGGGTTADRGKRLVKERAGRDPFGVQYGEQFKGARGAKGDAIRSTSGGGMQPFAYLPLAPRLLGKKHQRKAAETIGRLTGKGKIAKKSGAVAVGRSGTKVKGLHGLQKRRSQKR